MVGAQVALALVLLAGAGLLVASFRQVLAVDPGFDARRVLTGAVVLPEGRYPEDEDSAMRPRRLSPLHYRLQDLGAVFGKKNGWERVNYFDSGQTWRQAGADQKNWGWERPPYFDLVGSEVKAARERVALFDITSFGKIRLRGAGAPADAADQFGPAVDVQRRPAQPLPDMLGQRGSVQRLFQRAGLP